MLSDLKSFHELQSNPKVLQFADGEVKDWVGNKKELEELIQKYAVLNNDFWIYAIERTSDAAFVGTLALVKDGVDDEIGYRFLEKYWNKGYGFEICEGTIRYCKKIGIKKLVGYIVDKNSASTSIVEKFNFKVVDKFISDDLQLPETKYELIL